MTTPTFVPLPDATRLNIAEYTLGTLHGDEENQIRELINSNDEAVHQALHWETVLLAMADRLPPVNTEPLILARVQRTLGLPRLDPAVQPLWRPETPAGSETARSATTEKTPDAPARHYQGNSEPAITPASHAAAKHLDHKSTTRTVATQKHAIPEVEPGSFTADAEPARRRTVESVWYKRPSGVLAIMGVAAVVVLGSMLFRKESTDKPGETSPTQEKAATLPDSPLFIAILQPPQSTSTPGWVIVQNSLGKLRAAPRLQSQRASDQGLALWTRQTDSSTTRFLGWVSDTSVNDIALPEGLEINEHSLFEITQEKQNADISLPPDGPVLFIGQAVKTTLPEPVSPTATPPAQPR